VVFVHFQQKSEKDVRLPPLLLSNLLTDSKKEHF
jgi:hypothetical protein